MPTPRFAFGMAVGNNGRLYAIGGHGSSTFLNAVEEYDPTTDSWQTRAALPTARMDVAAIAASDGKIYAIGGCCPLDGGYLASVEAYDPSSNSWTTRASLPVATCCVSVANSPDGKIYAFGVPGSGVVQSYDPLTDSWSTKASLPTARWYTGAAADNSGRIYVVGGYKDERPQNAFFGSVPTVDAYKLATDSWSPRPNLQYPRYNLGVTMSNGKIYAIGGFQVESMLHVGRTLATVEEASPRVLSTQALVDAVENLRDQGVLNQGQRNALVAKLEAALRKINDGRPDSAAKELEGFIRHVNALVGQGTLSTTQGEAIIGEATDVISELEAS